MKKLWIVVLVLLISTLSPDECKAQLGVAQIIATATKKVIKAFDLKVQRLQNRTIWLQNAQKELENTLSQLKLREISDWTDKQRNLYEDYFQELNKVKDLISYYHRIRDISRMQLRLIEAYKKAWNMSKQDKHFSAAELEYMSRVYTGILNQSLNNIDRILMVMNSFQTQMTDAKRLELIRQAADDTDRNYFDLLEFNKRNILISLSRAEDSKAVETIKKLYGL
jgi:hypothetical protein